MKSKELRNKKNLPRRIIAAGACVLLAMLAFTYTGCSNKDDDVEVYTVTFDTDGGSPVPGVQRVEAGSTATPPAVNPTKDGYVFAFWHLNGATTAYNFQTPVRDHVTLYARWTEEASAEYWQVTWNLNGGEWPSGDNHATQVVKGGTLPEPATPVRSGYLFEGWYKEAALTNKVSFPYDVNALTADFTLYARWETEKPVTNSIARVASGRYSYFVLMADGTLYATGYNNYGQLGTGDKNNVDKLTVVADGVAAVYTGSINTLIVKTDGSVWGTGRNAVGELGLGDEADRSNFTAIPVNSVKEIAAGSYHTHLLKDDGSLWATGSNFYGQLGVGDNTGRSKFTATNLTSGVTAVSAGSEHSLALKKDGTVWGTGYGYMGSLGETAVNAENISFTQVFSGAKAIATGGHHSLILKNDGTVYASGMNGNGQAGVGSKEDVKAFTQAVEATGTPLTNVARIFAGYYSSFALKTDGTLWAAGGNDYGQFGTGDEADRLSFTRIASDIESMSAGYCHSLLLKKDGTTETLGPMSPYDQLGGSGTIHIKVNDTRYYQYINSYRLFDRNSFSLLDSGEDIATGSSGVKISVKPGIYAMQFYVSNSTVPYHFSNFPVAHKETVTILYEYVSGGFGSYRWTVTRSK